MNKKHWSRRDFLEFGIAGSGLFALAACGGTGLPEAANAYRQKNLASSTAAYQARFTFPDMVNAWGIAIRPQGAGGHFWVTGGGKSWQFVGDVTRSTNPQLQTLFQDGLREMAVPGADSLTSAGSLGKATGTVYNGADLDSPVFRVNRQTANDRGQTLEFDGSARFIFVTDSGKVSAWTDRLKSGAIARVDGPAQEVFDGSSLGMAFFGVAIKPNTWNRLWLADFGDDPQVRTLDQEWNLVETRGFINPFATGAFIDAVDPTRGRKAKPGDAVPFNIQAIGNRVFVMYCISRSEDGNPATFLAAEEDALDASAEAAAGFRPGKGKLVEYDLEGNLIRQFQEDGRLNAPWGIAIAPPNFGLFSGAVLIGNFGGNGTIAGFDDRTGSFIDFLKTEQGDKVKIPGLWGLTFGNGSSLGDSDALYFAAGPADETEGVFGSLRYADR